MKVFWRLLRFIQGHKWRSFTLQHSCGTKSGMKIRVYRQWYIRVSVNPGVNPCKPPLVFGQESFESIMHTCYHLFTTYPDIFQRISSTLGLVCRLNVGFKCSPVNPTADAFTLHCLKMCCKHWYFAWEHACFMRIDAFTLRCGMNRQYPRDVAFKSAR